MSRWVHVHRGQLSLRACEALADERVCTEVIEGTTAVCHKFSLFLLSHSCASDAFFNFKETRLVPCDGNLTKSRIESADKERAISRSTYGRAFASLLTFIAANGSAFIPVYVLRAKFSEEGAAVVRFKLERAPRTTRSAWLRFYC